MVGNVIAVQVQSGDDRIVFGNKQRVLQESVSDAVLNDKTSVRYLPAELALCQFISPFLETAFGELHDVPLVYQRNGGKVVLERIEACRTYQPFRPFFGDRLHAKGRGFGKTHLSHPHLLMQETVELFRLRRSGFPFDAGIDVLGIFAKHTHVYFLRLFHWRDYAFIPAHRAQAHIQVERLTQRHVQRTDAAAHRRSQRSLNAYLMLPERLHCLFRQPRAGFMKRPFARRNLFPLYAPAAPIGFFQGCVHNGPHGRGHLCPNSVTRNKRYSNFFHILSCI